MFLPLMLLLLMQLLLMLLHLVLLPLMLLVLMLLNPVVVIHHSAQQTMIGTKYIKSVAPASTMLNAYPCTTDKYRGISYQQPTQSHCNHEQQHQPWIGSIARWPCCTVCVFHQWSCTPDHPVPFQVACCCRGAVSSALPVSQMGGIGLWS